MKKILEAAVILVGTLGWWGFVYPELCLPQKEYEEILQEENEVEIKSLIAEYIYQIREAEKEGKHD